ncbi:hypothetical protein Y1Q_0004332 [Alligator mississippiensis]|uniref:Uncharacterized protein n=1 Tax=Alligator mississippiensis TaxID=8496 RepID=A0A151MIF0_ALLMI|nr:hypothetical protein Y1Q_0004332 [Alligator mississippiensis]
MRQGKRCTGRCTESRNRLRPQRYTWHFGSLISAQGEPNEAQVGVQRIRECSEIPALHVAAWVSDLCTRIDSIKSKAADETSKQRENTTVPYSPRDNSQQ